MADPDQSQVIVGMLADVAACTVLLWRYRCPEDTGTFAVGGDGW